MGCEGCEHLYGQVQEGRLLVCAMHPYGRDYCPDYSQENNNSNLALDYREFFSDHAVPAYADRDVAKINDLVEKHPDSEQSFQALCKGIASSSIDAIVAALNQINESINK